MSRYNHACMQLSAHKCWLAFRMPGTLLLKFIMWSAELATDGFDNSVQGLKHILFTVSPMASLRVNVYTNVSRKIHSLY